MSESTSGAAQRWGIIGLGAQADGIAKALQAVDGVELAGCMTATAARVAEFAAAFGWRPHRSEAYAPGKFIWPSPAGLIARQVGGAG
ncbi:MAG TPA: hypothetical protein VNF07_08355 [Acidimicrobiales bacterium]|nr:hypothetical protein [Acidimicrobiales bacterium]